MQRDRQTDRQSDSVIGDRERQADGTGVLIRAGRPVPGFGPGGAGPLSLPVDSARHARVCLIGTPLLLPA